MDRRILRAAYVYLVVFFVSNGVLMSTISLYLAQRWGANIPPSGMFAGVSSVAGVMLALRALAGILGGPVAGVVSDQLGNRWPVIRVSLLLAMTGFLVLVIARGMWAIAAGITLVALSAGALIAVIAAVVGDLTAGHRTGITMGRMATAGDLGSATGPLLSYLLVPILDLHWIYLVCAILLASCLLATRQEWHSAKRSSGHHA